MDVNDNAFILNKRVATEIIASKLAPTGVAFIQVERFIVAIVGTPSRASSLLQRAAHNLINTDFNSV